GQVREHAGVESGKEPRELRLVDVLLEVVVVDRVDGVPAVLVADMDDHLVEERVAEARDLHPRPAPLRPVSVVAADLHLAAARTAPDPEHGDRAQRVAWRGTVPR